jgi:chromosome segregation ATPase
VRKLEIEISD